MSFKNPPYACTDCGFPAASIDLFRDDVDPYRETLSCPKCGGKAALLET